MLLQLFPLGFDVNENIPKANERKFHDGILIFLNHNENIHPDLLNPDLKTGMAPFCNIRAFYIKDQKNLKHWIYKGDCIKMIYPLAYISIILVFRNKVIQTDTFIFWYMGLISGVFISLMFLFFLHLAGFDEVTLTTSSLVNIFRCGQEHVKNIAFIGALECTLMSIELYDDIDYIRHCHNTELSNKEHRFIECITERENSITKVKHDPTEDKQYCYGIWNFTRKGKNLSFILRARLPIQSYLKLGLN